VPGRPRCAPLCCWAPTPKTLGPDRPIGRECLARNKLLFLGSVTVFTINFSSGERPKQASDEMAGANCGVVSQVR
jgi:hypothetical protein